jgi:hypothetical protein
MLSLNVCNPDPASWLWLSVDYGLDGSYARGNRRTAGYIKHYPE